MKRKRTKSVIAMILVAVFCLTAVCPAVGAEAVEGVTTALEAAVEEDIEVTDVPEKAEELAEDDEEGEAEAEELPEGNALEQVENEGDVADYGEMDETASDGESAEDELEEVTVEPVIEELSSQEEGEEMTEITAPGKAEENRDAVSDGDTDISVAQAIWTSDNTTLTFYYGPLVAFGDTISDGVVTSVWAGTYVTDSGNGNPNWLKVIENTVTRVVFDESFKKVKPTSMANWFSYCSNLKEVDTRGLDTSNVTTMYYLFGGCNSLESVDVSHFDTSNVTDMRFMFIACEKLAKLDVKRFDTSKVRLMYGMFSGCSTLAVLDLSGFDVSKVEDMNRMFDYCYNLTTIYCKDENTDWSDKCKELTMFWFCTPLAGRFGDRVIKYSNNKIKGDMAKAASLGGYFTPKEGYFVIGKDSNSFKHEKPNFIGGGVGQGKIGTEYTTSQYYFAKLVSGLSTPEKVELLGKMNSSEGWGGSCRGLVTSLGMACLKKLDISHFNSTNGGTPKCYNDLAAPIKNLDLRDLINYYQLIQYVDKNGPKKQLVNVGNFSLPNDKIIKRSRKGEFWESFAADVKEADSLRIPLLFSMGYGHGNGHSVLTCGYSENDDYYIIQIYDPNYSSPASDEHCDFFYFFIDRSSYDFWISRSPATVKAVLNYSSNENWHDFSYYGTDYWDGISSFNDSADVNNSFISFTTETGKPFRLTNLTGQYLEYDNDELQGTLDVYDLKVLGDSSEYRFELPDDEEYSISNFNGKEEFSFRTGTDYLSAAVEGADSINVKNGNTVVLDGDTISYTIRLSMNTKTALMELSGTSSANVSIKHVEDKIIIEADDHGEVGITIYDTEGNITSDTINGGSTIVIDENEYVTYIPIEQCDVRLAKDKVVYTGKEQTPAVFVSNGTQELIDQKDYTVAYEYNINPGTATVKIIGMGSYAGTITKSFSILLGKTTRGDMFNLANNVKVTWKEVPGAKYYKVYREGITDKKETQKEPVIVTERLVGWDKEPGLTNGYAYRYKIVASLTGKGDSSGDSPLSYSKVMYRLKTVVIRSVKNTAPGKVTVKYDKTTSGDSYVLQYCEREDMVGAKTKVVLGANNTSYTIGGLKKGKTYYISIRVRKKVNGIDYYTTFGVPKRVTISK